MPDSKRMFSHEADAILIDAQMWAQHQMQHHDNGVEFRVLNASDEATKDDETLFVPAFPGLGNILHHMHVPTPHQIAEGARHFGELLLQQGNTSRILESHKNTQGPASLAD